MGSPSSKPLRRVQADGIHDEPLSVLVALGGERHALLAGDLESPDLHYRLWVDALARLLADAPDPDLRGALDLLESASRLSSRVVLNSSLGGYPWPDHHLGRKLGVPDDIEYARLCDALTIPAEELDDAHGLNRSPLGALIRSAEAPALWQPLVASAAGGLLVADPWRLTLAALVRACSRAVLSSRLPALLELLTAAALEVAVEAAGDMDWQVERLDHASVLAHADANCRLLLSVYVLPPQSDAVGAAHVDAPRSLAEYYERTANRARELAVEHALIAVLSDGRGVVVGTDHPCLRAVGSADPWLLGVADLRLLGDALRRDPLALPSALECSPRPPWPQGIDLVDVVGGGRREEEPPPVRRDLPEDGTEHLRLRARYMAARHPAPLSDGSGWGEVSRWGRSPDPDVVLRA